MKKIYGLLFFFLGAGGGAVGGYLFAKKKYEGLADKEVASVKESLQRYYENKVTKKEEQKKKETIRKIPETAKSIIQDTESFKTKEFVNYSGITSKYSSPDIVDKPVEKDIQEDAPYVITPEEFGYSEYECQTLFYYADKVLADDDYNQLNHIKDTIGLEAIRALDKNVSMDSIYVRNDRLKIDYEILCDTRNYWDLTSKVRRYPDVEDDE